MLPWIIEVKTAEEIVKMRAAGKVARQVLDIAGQAVRAGISTDEIDALVHEETIKVSQSKKHNYNNVCLSECSQSLVRPFPREEHIHLP